MIISFGPRSGVRCMDADVKILREGQDVPSRFDRQWVGNRTRLVCEC